MVVGILRRSRTTPGVPFVARRRWRVGAIGIAGLMVTVGGAQTPVQAASGDCALLVSVVQDEVAAQPLGIDRSGNILARVDGDGHLLLVHPDGSETDVNPYSQGGPWYSETGTLYPDGRVVGEVFYYGNKNDPATGYKGFVWADGVCPAAAVRGRLLHRSNRRQPSRRHRWLGKGDRELALGEAGHLLAFSDRQAAVAATLQGLHQESAAYSIDRDGRIYGAAWSPLTSSAEPQEGLGHLEARQSEEDALPHRFEALEVSNGNAAGYVTRRNGTERPAFHGPEGLSVPLRSQGRGRKCERSNS